MRLSKIQIGLFLALLIGNAIILFSDLTWSWLRWPTTLIFVFVLPGWAWLPVIKWMHTKQGIERIMLVGGVSSVLSALALLITVLLPGPFVETSVLIALNITIISGLILQFIKGYEAESFATLQWPTRKVLLILLAILAVAAFTRLVRLDYAEFHEDELENMRLIVRAYKGEEFAAFLDSKGPIHWLLPASLWYLNGWGNEGIVRTPFAITALLLIPTAFALGRRMSGRDTIGLLAAGFVALNGFFVAYARFVENQSFIVLWGALAMWFVYRYYKEDRYSHLLYAAMALAIGLIAHPDVLLYLPVFVYMIGFKLWQTRQWKTAWPWLAGAVGLFVGVVAIFYVPYLLSPQISLVYQYFADERVGDSFLYNRVYNLFDQDQLYSSRYHAPVLVLLLVWLLARNFAQWRWKGGVTLVVLGLAVISTVSHPQLWIINDLNLAFIPYALITLLFIFLPRTSFEQKTLFLWMMVPLGGLLFLAKDAADHIQIAYTAWAILAAIALDDLWYYAENLKFKRAIRSGLVSVLVLAAILTLYYQHLAFNIPVTGYWQIKIESENNPGSIYNRLYGEIPRPRKIFSNPRLGGWKAVGYMWATGQFTGDFRSINESFAVPIWYTFQTPRSCYNDPQHYWVRRDRDGWPKEETQIKENGYGLTHIVLVDGEPKLHLYQKDAAPDSPEILDMEEYRTQFDHLATPARFTQGDTGSKITSFDFDNKLRLHSYDLLQATAQPGQTIPVTLYWENLAPMDIRYRGFVHLMDDQDNRWGQHDDDPACRLLTTDMFPGQRSSRQFRLPVDPNTPPGQYQIIAGIYHPDTWERMEIFDNHTGQTVGNTIVLGHVTIE